MTSPHRAGSLQSVRNTTKRVEPVFDEEDGAVQPGAALKQRRVSTSPGRHVHFAEGGRRKEGVCVVSRLQQIREYVAAHPTTPRTKGSVAHVGNGRVSVASASWKTKLFHGLYAAVVTPLTESGQIAPEVIDPYAKHLRASGVNGVFVCGTAGMSMSLSVPERKTILEAWIKAGLDHDLEILAHIGAQSMEDSKELARHAEEVGALAVSAMAPSFFKPASAVELAAYIKEIAAAAPYTPFLYYHFPEITGVGISMADAMKELHRTVPTLRGGKFTSKDMWDLGDALDYGKSVGVEWDLMMGYEGQTTSALPLGITAHIGIAFSVMGPMWNRLIRAHSAKDYDTASQLQQLGRAWFKLFADVAGLPAMTAATKLMLKDMLSVSFGTMRAPQKALTAQQTALIHKAWTDFRRKHTSLFDHSGCLLPESFGNSLPAKATQPAAAAAAVVPTQLPGYRGEKREAIKARCSVVARKLSVEVKDVLSLLPHLEGPHSTPKRVITNVADAVDHTILKADASTADIEKLCAEAKQHSFYAVCVNSSRVAQCEKLLKGSGVGLASVVGFPLGAMCVEAKAFETREAVKHGATEIDMVLNIGALKEGDYAVVFEDISAVVKAAGSATVKVIFETCLLTEDQIIDASIMSVMAGAHYVKTSTGFSKSGASFEAVDAMKATVGSAAFVKASGGVRDLATAEAYLQVGVSRIGTSSGIAIVTGAASRGGY